MFGLSALELRLAAYGLLLAAIGGWMSYERFHLIDEGEAREQAKLLKSSQELLAKAQKSIADQAKQHAADVAANQVKLDAQLKANTALSDTLDQRVRAFNTYRSQHPDVPRTVSGSGTTGQGECGTLSCGDLASLALQDSDELARSLREVVTLLRSSQRDRDSLTGLPR